MNHLGVTRNNNTSDMNNRLEYGGGDGEWGTNLLKQFRGERGLPQSLATYFSPPSQRKPIGGVAPDCDQQCAAT